MHNDGIRTHVLTIILLLSIGLTTSGLAISRPAAYLDPTLTQAGADQLSVIVTGRKMNGAIEAVREVGGDVLQELWLIDAVSADVPANGLKRLAADPRVVSVVGNAKVTSSEWFPDVGQTPISNPRPNRARQSAGSVTQNELITAATVDVGANVLHQTQAGDGKLITGEGVTIAVVDSGVFFNRDVKKEFGKTLKHLFLGQADFVLKTCPVVRTITWKTITSAEGPGYCFQNLDLSLDGYGHGSHVAGLIWNNDQEDATGIVMGIAPRAKILSVRVLGDDGTGTYADTIAGIQYVVANRQMYNIRVINLSLSAAPNSPYFFDPLNRAVEKAWQSGIVVLAAAGNTGPAAETITVPGNDPYVITVGAVDAKRTPGNWADDIVPSWSASGPTPDGFIKPDVLAPGANLISYMYNNPLDPNYSAFLAVNHPDYSKTTSLFRMSGTSMSTAVASGVVALMLQADPTLTPDQVKFRLKYSALPFVADDGIPVYNPLQQGHGRVWAPAAVLGEFPTDGRENFGMDLDADLAHGTGWKDRNGDQLVQIEELDPAETAFHYAGPVNRLTSEDGSAQLYFIDGPDGNPLALGTYQSVDRSWQGSDALQALPWLSGQEDRLELSSDSLARVGGHYTWSGGHYTWSGGHYTWSGGHYTWSGGHYTWSGGHYTWSGGHYTWSGGWNPQSSPAGISSTRWVDEP